MSNQAIKAHHSGIGILNNLHVMAIMIRKTTTNQIQGELLL